MLDRGIYLQSACDYIHTVDLLQGIAFSTHPHVYNLGSRRVYGNVAKALLLNGAELSYDKTNLLVLCQKEELADLALKL